MKKIADGEPFTTPPTIGDPVILDEIKESLAGLGTRREEGEKKGHFNNASLGNNGRRALHMTGFPRLTAC